MTFEYGWSEREGGKNIFWVKFNSCTRVPMTWKEEILSTARSIAASSTKPLWLCSSGGIDSEIMCRAFRMQDIPFSVLTIEHAGGTNRHDIRYARKWCEENGVHQKIVQIDIEKFINKEAEVYAQDGYIADKPFRYLQIKFLEIVEEFGGYAVLGGGEQLYRADNSDSAPNERDVYLEFDPGYPVSLEWCKKNNASHQPYFYFSTPELCLSYLQIPVVTYAITQPDLFRQHLNSSLLKRIVYHSIWGDLQPRYKYNGFEHVLRQDTRALMGRLEKRFEGRLERYRLPVTTFKEQLSHDLVRKD